VATVAAVPPPPVTMARRMLGRSLPNQRAGFSLNVSQSTIAWPAIFRNCPGLWIANCTIWVSVR
jgi:hypothetical protein